MFPSTRQLKPLTLTTNTTTTIGEGRPTLNPARRYAPPSVKGKELYSSSEEEEASEEESGPSSGEEEISEEEEIAPPRSPVLAPRTQGSILSRYLRPTAPTIAREEAVTPVNVLTRKTPVRTSRRKLPEINLITLKNVAKLLDVPVSGTKKELADSIIERLSSLA